MAALLSVALLPIGMVAIMQTQSVAQKAEVNAELALLALTERAASQERRILARARGVTQTLAATMPRLSQDSARCSATLADMSGISPDFSFLGFIPVSGLMTCSSDGEPFNFSGIPQFRSDMEDPRPLVTVNVNGPISGTSVLTVSEPVYAEREDSEFLGYVSLSIPHDRLDIVDRTEVREALVDLITFNSLGELLTAADGLESATTHLPQDVSPIDLVTGERQALTLMDRSGEERIYTIATIEPGQVYALGVWDKSASVAGQTRGDIITLLYPALMWAAGLVVALIAVNQLVTRHLQVLGRQMALFTATRRLPEQTVAWSPPTEIRRIQRAFHRMTEALIRDEARQENAVHEKSVLVKEIHHRVKNNLQLISSIINMQVREATSPEAKIALRQTQDRVLSMATIHRDLYQTNETGLVDVGRLVSEVVGTTIEMNPEMDDLDLTLDVEDVWLYPDQAVPMSLLASEAVINALKHMPGEDEDGAQRWLKVALHKDDEGLCTFRTANASHQRTKGQQPSRGMGRKLIRSFATQLGAQVAVVEDAGTYRLTVEFKASEFAPLPGRY